MGLEGMEKVVCCDAGFGCGMWLRKVPGCGERWGGVGRVTGAKELEYG